MLQNGAEGPEAVAMWCCVGPPGATSEPEGVFVMQKMLTKYLFHVLQDIFFKKVLQSILVATYLYSPAVTAAQDNYLVAVSISICCVTVQREESRIVLPGSMLYLSRSLKCSVCSFFSFLSSFLFSLFLLEIKRANS